MKRYTANQLYDDINDLNIWLESSGCTIRLVAGGRNNYSAVDEYSVDDDGQRIGSGVNRNVMCGTPRECLQESKQHASYAIIKRLKTQQERQARQ